MSRLKATDIDAGFRAAAESEYRKKFSRRAVKLSAFVESLIKKGKNVESVSKRTIENFFNETTRNVNLSTVDSISHALFFMSYEEWIQQSNTNHKVLGLQNNDKNDTETKESSQSYDKAIALLLGEHHEKNMKRYNSVKILTMDAPLDLDKIYVDVNLLRRKTKREILVESVDRHGDFDNFEDIISSTFAVEEMGIDSFDALERFTCLMVWGGLGTGKTTFLKTIATRKNEDLERHPVFIELRSLVERRESILEYIHQELYSRKFPSGDLANILLNEGKLLILLDGLDEVSKSDFRPLCKQIEDFVERYPFNQFVLSCRYGIYDYGFKRFTEVEIARLSDEKIKDFVDTWFSYHKNEEKGEKVKKLLEKNKLLKDFASTPLMLNMLCLNIEAGYGVPENIYSVYDKAVKASAERWDQNRFIDRDATKLTTSQRLSFLADLAFDGLDRSRKVYTWEIETLRKMVRAFIQDSAHYEPSTIEEDCSIEIQAIEGYHSLLERTSDDIYRFSTPAYQHYFAADYAESSRDRELLKNLVDRHILDKQWREIFVMIAEKLKDATDFVKLIFEKSNAIAGHQELQELLLWAHEFTQRCNVSSSSWRAGVLTIDMELDLRFSRYSIPSETRTVAHKIALSSRELNRRNRAIIKPSPDYTLRLALASALSLAEDQIGENTLSLAQGPSEFAKVYLGDGLLNVYAAIQRAMENKHILSEKVSCMLEEISNTIPQKDAHQSAWDHWAKVLQDFMIKNLEIGQNIELSNQASNALTNYLYVQEIVVQCLLVNARIGSDIRNNIRQNLMMPNSHRNEIA